MSDSNEPVIIASESQGEEVEAKFGERYQQVNSGFNAAGSYPLRPGVDLLLYVRRDLDQLPKKHPTEPDQARNFSVAPWRHACNSVGQNQREYGRS